MKIKQGIIQNGPIFLYSLYHPYRIIIIGGSGSGKTNALLNVISN